MTMVTGNVTVDDDGVETYTPNDATSYSKALYLVLLDGSTTSTQQVVIPGTPASYDINTGVLTRPTPPTYSTETHTVAPTPMMKQATAKIAVAIAGVIDFLKAHGTITITIPVSAGGDGLQTSQAAGQPTTHPAAPKSLTGTLT